MENIQPEKNVKTAESVKTKEGEIAWGEQINMVLNEGNHLNNTPSHKSNHAETGKNNQIEITMHVIRHKMKVVLTTERGYSLSVSRLWKILKDGNLKIEWDLLLL